MNKNVSLRLWPCVCLVKKGLSASQWHFKIIRKKFEFVWAWAEILNYCKEKVRQTIWPKKIDLLLMLKMVNGKYKCDINCGFK